MRRFLIHILLLFVLAAPANAHAQSGIRVTSIAPPEYTFGQSVTFQMSAESSAPIEEVTLYLRTPDETRTFVGKARFTRGNAVEATYVLEPSRRSIAAFSPVEYWWEIKDDTGASLLTDTLTFTYADNRHTWQTLSDGPLNVHWIEGEGGFGQTALDIAAEGLARANRDLRAPPPERVDLYIYPDRFTAAEALRLTNRQWAEGQANPRLGVIIVTVPPEGLDSLSQMEREIPHELTHILVYQATGESYVWVPNWLNEGLATMYQTQPDPDAPAALQNARDMDALLSLEALCGPFPGDAAQAQLAYVQSESVVRYIRDRHGALSLSKLLAAYADGLDCESGVRQVLNLSLAQLESQWLEQAINANPATLQLRLWAPWLVVGALVILGPFVFFIFMGSAKLKTRMV